MKRAFDVAFRAVAAVLCASLLVAASHDVSKAWDAWYYHLPFAARIAGLLDPAAYAFSRANQRRFEGFPLLAEALQGLMWRVTGRVEAANVVSFAALPALALALRRLFAVPLAHTFVALLAIPLVQIHATAAYVDLPANACAAMLWLLAYRAAVDAHPPSLRTLALAGALAAAVVNAKFQLVPIAIAGGAIFLYLSVRTADGRRARLCVVALAMPVIFATPIKNAVRYGNPVWPVELALGRSLPHTERAYSSSPDWLEHAPRPARFAASALELGLRPIASHRRWSIDQWTPPREDGYRLGGFFGGYVVVNLSALALAVTARRRTREAKIGAGLTLALTAMTSVMPQSHELRYYLVWMLVLVSMNLVLWAKVAPRATAAVALGALAIVAWSTDGTYLYASGERLESLRAAKVDGTALDRARPGARVCVMREPWTFLYAPVFHPGRSYAVQEAEEPDDCAGAPMLE